MTIDNSSLEIRPLVLQVEDDGSVVTHVESPVLDLQELHVTKYNHLLKVVKKNGGASKIKAALVSNSDVNLLALAVLNSEEEVLTANGQPFALSSVGQNLGGSGDTKTFRKFCQAVSVASALYDEDGNFTGLDGSVELSFKSLEDESAPTFGENLVLSTVTTAVVDGYTKLTSVSGKCFDGTTITLDALTNGNLGLAIGDSCWIEFTVRNEGLVVVPKVTGLTAPVDGTDAVNLDFVEAEVTALEAADTEALAYISDKIQDLSDRIANQDSFFAPTQIRWNGSRALALGNGGLLTLPNMSQLTEESSIVGLALTNPVIDEAGLSPEQLELSYSRRVYTSGIVRNVVAAWNSPKGDVYAGPNGTLVELPPTSGRIIKLGQKVGTNDIMLAIQDYGFVYGIRTVDKGFDFGKLTPTPPPYPQLNNHFIGLGRPSTEGMFGGGWKSSLFKINSDNRLDPEISLSEFQTSDTSKYELGSAAKFPDGSGNFVVMSYYPRLNGLGDDTINNVDNNLDFTVPPRPNYILKFNAEGQLIGSCLAPLSDIELPRRKLVYGNGEISYQSDGEGVFAPLMLLPMANGSIAYIAYVHNINGFSGYDGFAAQLKQMYPEEADSHGPWSIRMWIINPDMTVSSESTWLEGSPIIPIERYGAQSEGGYPPFWTLVKPDFPIFGQVVSEDGNVMFPVLTSDDIQSYFKPIWFTGNGKVVEGQSDIDWGAQLVNPRLKLVKISGDGSVNYIDLCDATPFNRQNWWNQLNTLIERSSEMAIVTSDGTYALGTTLGIIKVSSDNVVTNLPIPQEIFGANPDGSGDVDESVHIEKLLDLFEREDGSIVFRGALGGNSWGYYFVGVLNADNTYEPFIIIPDVYDSIMKGVLRNNGTYLLVEDVSSVYHVVDLSTRQVTKFTPDLNSLFGDNNPFIDSWNPNPQYTDLMWQWRQNGSFYNKENDSFIFGGRFEDWIPETDEYKQGVMLLAIKDDNTMVEVTTPETRFSGISIQVVI